MNDILDFVQGYWYEVASLLFQCAILLTLAWYGRKTLRILRASRGKQNEVVQVQRASLSNVADERAITQEAAAATEPLRVEPSRRRAFAPWRLLRWLRAPMGSERTRSLA